MHVESFGGFTSGRGFLWWLVFLCLVDAAAVQSIVASIVAIASTSNFYLVWRFG